ncbi:MAG: hypothetical protein PUJ30_00700 [Bacteroidales bacterium]|nr:hypothetical protein [Bacteroidales bacterium]MDY4620735.1 hypothetical protein [Alloprevotella sp.]
MLLTAARRKVRNRLEGVMIPEEKVESRRLRTPFFDEKRNPDTVGTASGYV